MKNKMNKKGIAPILLLGIIASLITILASLGLINTASILGTGGWIERPVFFYDKCEAVGGLSYSTPTALATSGQWLPKPTATSEYNVRISTSEGSLFFPQRRVEYYICNSMVLSDSNCRIGKPDGGGGEVATISTSGSVQINGIRLNEYVWAQYQKPALFGWGAGSGASYQIGYIPYGLRQYNVLGGSANPVNPNSCTYSSKPTDTILSTNSQEINSYKPSINTNENTLKPNEVRWYVAGYVTSASPSFTLTYGGKEAWCRPTGSNAEIYKIAEIQTPQGTYKVASVDWNDKIGTETCCPGQKEGSSTCNSNFKWETTAGTQCSLFNSCGSANWVPYSEGQIIKYSCVEGSCKPEIKEVECASNFDCTDTNQICDLNTFKCVEGDVNLKGQKIETVPDNLADCQAKGGTWISQTSEKSSLWNFIGIGSPEVIVKEYCELEKPIDWFKVLLIGGIIFILIIFWKPIYSVIRALFKRFGI